MDSPNLKINNAHFFDVGSCEIIFGPMFSGKTSTLLGELTESADIGLKVLYINHQRDVRDTEFYSYETSTHSSQFKGISDKLTCRKTEFLKNVAVDHYDVIGIDEGQWFEDLVEVVREWVLEKNKRVVIASLDGSFKMESFGHAHKLVCLCDPGGIKKLGARCKRCMLKNKPYRHYRLVPAGFTIRTQGGNALIESGGAESYEAVCMKCYKEYSEVKEYKNE